MDEELKIVVTSVLEADEEASAKRIVSHLPEISRLVNNKSSIKIGVELDASTISSGAQKISKELSRAASHEIGVYVNLDTKSVNKIRDELSSLHVNSDITALMTKELNAMGVQIDKVSGSWKKAEGNERKLLQLTIQGTDSLGKNVTLIQQYNAETGKVSTEITNVVTNLERQRQVEKQIADQARRDNKSRQKYLANQEKSVAKLQALYKGDAAANPLVDQDHISEVDKEVQAVISTINTLKTTSGALGVQSQIDLERQISKLELLIKGYQNVEYAARKAQVGNIDSVKDTNYRELDLVEEKLRSAGLLTEDFKRDIDGLRASLGSVFDQKGLVSFANSFNKLNEAAEEQLRQLKAVDAIYAKIESYDLDISEARAQMSALDPSNENDSELLSTIQKQVAELEEGKRILIDQLSLYEKISQEALKIRDIDSGRAQRRTNAEIGIAEEVYDINRQMPLVNAKVDKLVEDFQLLDAPTENLSGNIEQMRTLLIGVNNASSDQEKIAVFNRLRTVISDCTAEMNILLKAQRELATANGSRVNFLTRQEGALEEIHSSYTGASSAKPVTDGEHLAKLNGLYDALEDKIKGFYSVSGNLSAEQRAEIEKEIAALKLLVKEYQNAEYIATQLRTKNIDQIKAEQTIELGTVKSKLTSDGILTGGFNKEIEDLENDLKKAFDPEAITKFLNRFDTLKNNIKSFREELRAVDDIYDDIIKNENRIAAIDRETLSLDVGSDESHGRDYDRARALAEERDYLIQQNAQLDKSIGLHGEIYKYSSKAKQLAQEGVNNEIKLNNVKASIADNAREATVEMSKMNPVVENIRRRLATVNEPTTELVADVNRLNTLMSEFGDTSDDLRKVQIYEQFQETLRGCNDQITKLLGNQRLELLDANFPVMLEKAKADLATVERQWSAFKHDSGLNRQFEDLRARLNSINGIDPVALKRWNAELNAFKSSVKAAGRNMQSFGDTIKSNIAKVAQWATATTSIYEVLNLLRRGIDIVVELDTAMIDLRKTTDATEAEYRQFYTTANQTAKALNVTTQSVINQTAEWSRLGYSLEQASELAKNSAIFAAVSPEMDEAVATDGLISIIKAFGVETDNVLDGIISKINVVGNEFAVTNADIVEVLTRSSAAMAAANNTFEETVSLATAA